MSEHGFGSQFAYGFLTTNNFFAVLQMLVQPGGEPSFAGLCAGAVDVLKQRTLPEDIEVERIQVGGISVFIAAVEGRGVIVQRGQFLLVHFHFLFQVVFAGKQAVVSLDQEQEREHGDNCNGAKHAPALVPKVNQSGHAGHEQYDA